MRPVNKSHATACLLDAKNRKPLEVAEALHYVICNQCAASIEGDAEAESQWLDLAEQIIAGSRSATEVCSLMGARL